MQAGTTGFSETLQPAALTTAERRLDRPERRRRPAGRARLRLPDAPAARSTSRSCRRASASPASRPSIRTSSGCTTSRRRSASSTRSCRACRCTGGWYHRDYHNLRRRDNTLQTFADYTPFTLFSPIDGTPITYYNVSAAKRVRGINYVDTNAASDRKMWFNGFEYNFNARLPHGITLFGGGMSERMIAQVCDETVEPEPAALLRSDQERPAVPDAVQDRRLGADHVRHPGRLLVPEPAGLPLRHGALSGRDRRSPARAAAVGDAAEHAERRGHGVADHADDHATRRRARAWRRASARSVSWSTRA